MLPWQVDLTKFDDRFKALLGVKYKLGAKDPYLGAPSSQIEYLDCSGFTRDEIYSAAGVVIPDGSYIQREYFEKVLSPVPYGPAQNDLLIFFLTAGVNGVGSVGHVGFARNGVTYECYGGHGVGSRPWNTPVLKDHVHKAFRLPFKTAVKGYSLFASDEHLMKVLPVYDGHAYVAARTWADWFKQQVAWDAPKVLLNGNPLDGDVKLIPENGRNVAYIPFTTAAAFTGVSYVVDNAKHEIRLKPGM